jgi:hypothetical protein
MIIKSKQHLHSVNESYFKHMKVAVKVGLNMILAGLMALIHALIPGIFQSNASNKIRELYEFINKQR